METEEKIIENPYGFIYITTNMVNGKRYLGQKRFDEWNKWKAYLGSGRALKNALKKYGKENFSRNIICLCYYEEELNQTEYDLSVFLNVVESNDWYNLEYGGSGCSGYHHTDETKKHLSEVLSGENHPWYGKHHSEESKQKMSEKHKGIEPANKGKSATEETKQKLRDAWIGRPRNFSDEVKKKMSESHKNPSDETREKLRNAQIKRYENQEERKKQSVAMSGNKNPRYGQHCTEETKEKIRKKAKERFKDKTKHPTYGRHLSDEQKQRLSECAKQRTGGKNSSSKRVIRLSDGKIYDYLASAAEENHMCKDTMTKRCKLHKDFMYYNEWIEQQNNLNNNKGDD